MNEHSNAFDYAEACLHDMESHQKPYTTTVKGMELLVLPGVFSPAHSHSTEDFIELLTKELREQEDMPQQLCEIGIGAGGLLLHFVKEYKMLGTGVDINGRAVANSLENAFRQDLQEYVDIQHGNIFSVLRGEKYMKKFDWIFWNMPFIKASPYEHLTDLERAFKIDYDEFGRYVRDAFLYKSPKGKVLLGFCKELGDEKELERICRANNVQLYLRQELLKSTGAVLSYQLYELLQRDTYINHSNSLYTPQT